jgi:multiple sugar transport system substrate-binding protein
MGGLGLNTRIAGAAAILAVAVVLGLIWPRTATTPAERAAARDGRTIITYWDRHSGHEHAERVKLFDEFNSSQEDIFVRDVAIGYNASMEKILTSTAGGAPPDIIGLDSAMLYQLAPQGIFLPLDGFMASTPALQQEKFFPHCWEMVDFDGHVWAVPTTTDVYCLLWNKALFRRAGLDPERPPENLAELEAYAEKLTLRDEAGRVTQVGFVPWLPWDLSSMWGGMFGSDWYNADAGHFEIEDDMAARASMAWQQKFTWGEDEASQNAFGLDMDSLAAFSKLSRNYMSANNLFYAGKVAMITEGEWQSTFIPKYAPGLEWGVAPIPQPDGVEQRGYGPACVVDAIPATARNPEAAMTFLAWFYSPRADGRPAPSSDYNFAIHNIPPQRDEATGERFMGDPKFRVFVEQLLDRPIVRLPVTPVTQLFTDQLERQRERVTLHRSTPEDALRETARVVNKELDRIRTMRARGAS